MLFKPRFILVDGRKLATYFWDFKKPVTMVFIHGEEGNATNWRPQLEFLAYKKLANLLAYDWYGHGQSENRYFKNYPVEWLVQDLTSVTRQADACQLIFVCHGLGSAIALNYLRSEIDKRVIALMMIAAPACDYHSYQDRLFYYLPDRLLDFVNTYLKANLIYLRTHQLSRSTTQAVIDQFLKDNPPLPPYVTKWKKALSGFDDRLLLRSLNVPIIAILGRQDALVDRAAMQELVAWSTRSQLHLVQNAGHFVQLEKPELVNRLLMKTVGFLVKLAKATRVESQGKGARDL